MEHPHGDVVMIDSSESDEEPQKYGTKKKGPTSKSAASRTTKPKAEGRPNAKPKARTATKPCPDESLPKPKTKKLTANALVSASSSDEEGSDYAEEAEVDLELTKPQRKRRKISEEGIVQDMAPDNGAAAASPMQAMGFDAVGGGDDFDDVEFDDADDFAASPKKKPAKKASASDHGAVGDDEAMDIEFTEEVDMEKRPGTKSKKSKGDGESESNPKKRKRPAAPRTPRMTKAEKVVIWDKHKASLVVLLAAAKYSNSVVQDELLQSIALSILPGKLVEESLNTMALDQMMKFVSKVLETLDRLFSIAPAELAPSSPVASTTTTSATTSPSAATAATTVTTTKKGKAHGSLGSLLGDGVDVLQMQAELKKTESLMAKLSQLQVRPKQKPKLNNLQAAQVTVAVLRALGGECRLVHKLRPLPSRPPAPPKAKSTQTEEKNESKGSKLKKSGSKLAEEKEETPALPSTWAEIYCPSEQRWVTIDCVRQLIDKPLMLGDIVGQPMVFVYAFENSGRVFDVSRRYTTKWTSQILEMPDFEWHEQTIIKLNPEGEPSPDEQERAALEEREFTRNVQREPFPTAQEQFRHHPLYVLAKFVGKYEMIWPKDASTAGTFKNEPIYWRKNLYKLHTKEKWVQFGKQVKEGELPVKQMRKVTTAEDEEINSDYFGDWQTQEYVPGVVENGILPRNDYGNVYMFKPTMLPIGAAHIRLPLKRVAKKLGIDCADAHVGWEIGHFMFKPKLEGVIVPAEHANALVEAYVEDEKARAEKQKLKDKQAKAQKTAKKQAKEKALEYVNATFNATGNAAATAATPPATQEIEMLDEEPKPAKKTRRRKSSAGSGRTNSTTSLGSESQPSQSTSQLKSSQGSHIHEYPKEQWKQLGGDQVEKVCKCGHKIVQEVL